MRNARKTHKTMSFFFRTSEAGKRREAERVWEREQS